MFTSVRARRVHEHIIGQIETAIFEGRLRSGDRLPAERALVREFRTSRVALREALRTLEHRGLVEVRHGAAGGHFVRRVDTGVVRRDFETLLKLGHVSVAHLTEARLLIEPEVAWLAARRATELDIKEMHAVVDARAELAATGAHPRLLDIKFHRLVAAAVGNPVHAIFIGALMDLETSVVLPELDLGTDDNERVQADHAEILDAIARRQPERARATMHAHIVEVQRTLERAAWAHAADGDEAARARAD